MKIYNTSIVKISDINVSDLSITYEIKAENYLKKSCIKDGDYMVDIESQEKYYILSRNENGTLKPSERNKIENGQFYVFSYFAKSNIKLSELIKAYITKKCLLLNSNKVLKR